MPELAGSHHVLPAQLPDRPPGSRSHFPHQPSARLRRGHHCPHYHQGQRGGLLWHTSAQRLHGPCLPTAVSARAEGLCSGCGDEALAAGLRHHLPGQDAHLLHHLRPVRHPLERMQVMAPGVPPLVPVAPSAPPSNAPGRGTQHRVCGAGLSGQFLLQLQINLILLT